MKQQQGTFLVSLDFELHWGCFQHMRKIDPAAEKYFQNTRDAIPEMLRLFSEGEVHVTWAVVGMLYCKSATDWKQQLPPQIPTFDNPTASAYEWVKENGFFSYDDLCHFAPQLIDLIKSTPYQEIGTHTFAHYFCLEKGQNIDQFREDIRTACRLAKEKGIILKSLVFPRNQFNESYLSVCREMGITSVRTNPEIWYWSYADNAGSFMKRFFRAGDAYLKLQPIKLQYVEDICIDELPLRLPATRLYRAWRPKFSLENKLKMKRILDEMTRAAQKGAYYHIWWHPHNFGYHPQECLSELAIIIKHFNKLKQEYGFRSMTMNELTESLVKDRTTSTHP